MRPGRPGPSPLPSRRPLDAHHRWGRGARAQWRAAPARAAPGTGWSRLEPVASARELMPHKGRRWLTARVSLRRSGARNVLRPSPPIPQPLSPLRFWKHAPHPLHPVFCPRFSCSKVPGDDPCFGERSRGGCARPVPDSRPIPLRAAVSARTSPAPLSSPDPCRLGTEVLQFWRRSLRFRCPGA